MEPGVIVLVSLAIILVIGVTFSVFILWYVRVSLELLESELSDGYGKIVEGPKKETKERVDIRC